MPQKMKYVYLFSEVEEVESRCRGSWEAVRSLLGGKGANLAEMTRLGVPVPPGFIITTDACLDYLSDGGMSKDVWQQALEAVKALEQLTDSRLGDSSHPLMVSCRSGAKISMPGMMDTILNIGLNDEVAQRLIDQGRDSRFIYDCYRRLVQMFGNVVLGLEDDLFERLIDAQRRQAGVTDDSGLEAEDWRALVGRFKQFIRAHTDQDFPSDPYDQLRMATEAVFKSWNSKRAIDYRNASRIPHDMGTAVNVQAMVFGNTGEDSATGVAMSRNAATGHPEAEGDFLVNAQGEDVVAGIRQTRPLQELKTLMPDVHQQLLETAQKLERHYRNMQDIEFTIEGGKLYLLQTRDGKRTAQAEVRIAVDMVEEGLISKEEAVSRVKPAQVDFFLHPQIELTARRQAQVIATGLNVSPGAGVGRIALDSDTAEQWGKQEGKDVILVRSETRPDDVHGMLAARGILTSRGGRTSHAALVARQFGKPAVVGVANMEISMENRCIRIDQDLVIPEGEWISIDGGTGEVFSGKQPTVIPEFEDRHLIRILRWADEIRQLGVWANADYPRDAERARAYGAEGIGLCRTEHMFFEPERLPIVRSMIMADNPRERREALDKLLPLQRRDFEGLFRAMDGCPITIRLIDPPLHEFLPAYEELVLQLADLKLQLQHHKSIQEMDKTLEEIGLKSELLERVEFLRESNPMLGLRGVRLGILYPDLTKMQVRAIFEAACKCAGEGVAVHPHVMIPLTCHAAELKAQQAELEKTAKAVMRERDIKVPFHFGTMIEIPRAALTAGELAETAEFFSFGTNDLTQTTFGISRDDAESGFLLDYLREDVLEDNPFDTIDSNGVGRLMKIAVQDGRRTRPDLHVGICGEHGGDPRSVAFCHDLGLDYVSCSPFRVPIARLAAAHAVLKAGVSRKGAKP